MTVTDYSLPELASLAGVTPRTVRYYIAQGLLPSPARVGPGARYGDAHLARLRLIKQLQGEHLPLAEIRARLATTPANDLLAYGSRSQTSPAARASESAVDYIRRALAGTPPVVSALQSNVPSASAAAPAASATAPFTSALLPSMPAPVPMSLDEPDETLPAPLTEPARSQWDRLALTPDIELHVRRPLSRPLNKKVEHLIRLARQLLAEDQP